MRTHFLAARTLKNWASEKLKEKFAHPAKDADHFGVVSSHPCSLSWLAESGHPGRAPD